MPHERLPRGLNSLVVLEGFESLLERQPVEESCLSESEVTPCISRNTQKISRLNAELLWVTPACYAEIDASLLAQHLAKRSMQSLSSWGEVLRFL